MARIRTLAKTRKRISFFISLILLVTPASSANNATTLATAFTSPSTIVSTSTLIPIVDTYLTLIELVLYIVISIPLFFLAIWILAIVLATGAHKNNNFVYHVLNVAVAVADVVLAGSNLIVGVEDMLAPNDWGGVASPLFNLNFCNIVSGIGTAATTQHYLAMMVIAGERLYSVLSPTAHQARGPPLVTTGLLSAFFVVNMVGTVCGTVAGSTGSYAGGLATYIVNSFNQYITLAFIFATVILYAALVIGVRRQAAKMAAMQQASTGGVPTANQAAQERQMEITKTVLKVAVVYVVTAFIFNMLLLLFTWMTNNGQMAAGPFDVANDFCYVPMTIGQYIDLHIFAVKIDSIAQPSIKYLKKIRYFGKQVPTKASTRTVSQATGKSTVGGGNLSVAPSGAAGVVEVQ